MPLSTQRPHQAALPMHLTLAMLPWLASNAALHLSKSDLQRLSLVLQKADNLPNELGLLWQRALNDPALALAVGQETQKRNVEFLQGLLNYQESHYSRDIEEFPGVFSHGSARLIDCGGSGNEPVVLLVPSLINRYYVLDLTRKLSLARHLKSQGLRVFMVDWGSPSHFEKNFDCADYVVHHLAPMAEWLRRFTNQKAIVAGYCMGGLLALALACYRPGLVRGLACLATPWDFSVPDFPKIAVPENDMSLVQQLIVAGDAVPAETIHTLFHLANPFAFQTKLREFAHMKPGSQPWNDFLAIEHWVQDGVPLVNAVAKDCLIEWPTHNTPAKLLWKVDGQTVNPASLKIPVFIAVPKGDKIVPSSCALPLVNLCKNATVTEPQSGHVGMIVGKNRKSVLWEPLSAWINHQVA